MTRYSRAMSWAVGSTWLTGGRRRAKARPAASVTRKVRLERPPAISSKREGRLDPGDVAGEPLGDRSASMPSTSPVRRVGAVRGRRYRRPVASAPTLPGPPPDGSPARHGSAGTSIGSVPMTDVTDATFEQAVLDRSGQVPVVVDLWAPWCGPCRTLGPILEQVVEATERCGRAGQGQRGREPPGVRQPSRSSRSPPSSPCGTARWSTASSGPSPRRRWPSSSTAWRRAQRGRPAGGRRRRGLAAPGARARAGPPRCGGRPGPAPDRPAATRGGAGAPGPHPRDGRARALAAEARLADQDVDGRPTTSTALLDALLDRVKRRRGGPPGVPRPARDARVPTTRARPATARRCPPGCSECVRAVATPGGSPTCSCSGTRYDLTTGPW